MCTAHFRIRCTSYWPIRTSQNLNGFACTCNATRIGPCYVSYIFHPMSNEKSSRLCPLSPLIRSHPLHDITLALLLKRARSVVAHSSITRRVRTFSKSALSSHPSSLHPAVRPSASVRPRSLQISKSAVRPRFFFCRPSLPPSFPDVAPSLAP